MWSESSPGHRGDGAARDLGLLDEDDGIALANDVARRHRDAARTMPPCGAVITCSIFMASTTAICWPWRTSSPMATSMATMVPWIGEATPAEPSGPVGARASSSTAAVAASAFIFSSCANSASGSRLLTRAPANPPSLAAGRAVSTKRPPPIRDVGDQRGHVLVDPASVDVAGGEVGMRQDVAEERDVGGDAFQPELAEGPRGPPHGPAKSGAWTMTLASNESNAALVR